MALAGHPKGLRCTFLPVTPAATVWILLGPRRFGWRLRPWLGAAVLAALFVPWHVLMQLRDPSFLQFYFVNEHLLRFFNNPEPIDYLSMPVGAVLAATLVLLF